VRSRGRLEAKDLAARAAMPLLEHRTRHDLLPVEMARFSTAPDDTPFDRSPTMSNGGALVEGAARPSLEDEAVRRAASAELLEEALDE